MTIQSFQLQAHSHLYREPALLALKCQEHKELQLGLMKTSQTRDRQRRASRNPTNSICDCHHYPQKSERHLYLYGLSSFWSRSVQHLPSCPLSRYAQQRVDTIGVKYTYCTKILGYSIAATFSATRGPGGLAINPQLTLRAVVPYDSPAFSLLKSMNYNHLGDNGQIPTLIDRAEWVLHQLTLLFSNGKASPMDITQDGRTLLHVSKVLNPQNMVIFDTVQACIQQIFSLGAHVRCLRTNSSDSCFIQGDKKIWSGPFTARSQG